MCAVLFTRRSCGGITLAGRSLAHSLPDGFILYCAGNFPHVLQRENLFRLAKRQLTGILLTACNYLQGICDDRRAKVSHVVLNNIARAMTTNCSLEGADWMLGNLFLPGGRAVLRQADRQMVGFLCSGDLNRQLGKLLSVFLPTFF